MRSVNLIIKKSFLLLILASIFLFGCNNPSNGSSTSNAAVVLDIESGGADFSTRKNLCAAYPGYVGKIKASLEDCSNTQFTWSSNNPDAVSVDSEGNVTYIGIGDYKDPAKAIITCTAANGNSASVECWSSFYPQFYLGGSWVDFGSTLNLKDYENDYRVSLFYYDTEYTSYKSGLYVSTIPYNNQTSKYSSYESSELGVINFIQSEGDEFIRLNKVSSGTAEITLTIKNTVRKFTVVVD